MIRTAILAGILLVMLSMAYSRPGAIPTFGARAPAPEEEQAEEQAEEQDALREEPVAKPVVHRAEPSRPAPVSANEEDPKFEEPAVPPAPVEEPRVAEVAPQPVTPAADPGRPISLLPPSMIPAPVLPTAQDAAAPAPLPEVHVPTRPVNAPQDLASRLTPEGKLAPAPQAELRAPMVAAAGTKFMTPQERSRELYKLAREMEDTFIENMTK